MCMCQMMGASPMHLLGGLGEAAMVTTVHHILMFPSGESRDRCSQSAGLSNSGQ